MVTLPSYLNFVEIRIVSRQIRTHNSFLPIKGPGGTASGQKVLQLSFVCGPINSCKVSIMKTNNNCIKYFNPCSLLKFLLFLVVLEILLSVKSIKVSANKNRSRKDNHTTAAIENAPKKFEHNSRMLREFECGSLKRYTLFFLHFQKCGGSSVEKSLEKFAKKCKYGYSRFPKHWRKRLSDGELTFLTGHIFYGFHVNLPKNWEYDYVAIFRDPFDRSWSHFKHNGERRCRCTFVKFSEMFTNYYQFKLTGSRSNTNKILKQALINLRQISITGYLNDIDSWYENLQDLLQKQSISPLTLPPLISQNIRNSSKDQGTSHVGTSYNMLEYEASRNSEDFEQIKGMNQNDYTLISELKYLRKKEGIFKLAQTSI